MFLSIAETTGNSFQIKKEQLKKKYRNDIENLFKKDVKKNIYNYSLTLSMF